MDGGLQLGLHLRGSGLIRICLFLGKLRLITLNNMAGSERRERCALILWTVAGQVEEEVDLLVCCRILSGRGERARAHTHTHTLSHYTYKDLSLTVFTHWISEPNLNLILVLILNSTLAINLV